MFKLSDPGDLVRNVSAILGFAPVESLVLILVGRGELQAVLRVDLGEAPGMGTAVQLADLVAGQNVDGAIAVVVSEKAASSSAYGKRLLALIGHVTDELDRRGSQLFGAVQVDRIAQGGRWSCMDGCGVAGVLEDPASSVMAAAVVADGRRLYGSREEMAATVAVDTGRVAAVARHLDEVEPVDCVAVAVRSAVAAMRLVVSGATLSDGESARIGASLVDMRVRDALMNVGGTSDMAAAERLWTLLARVLPEPFRVEALTLLAFSAFLRGDGPLAGVALEAALDDVPDHRMAGMLDVALQSGMRPEMLRGLVARIPAAVTV